MRVFGGQEDNMHGAAILAETSNLSIILLD